MKTEMVVFLLIIAVIFFQSSVALEGNGTLFEVHGHTLNALDAINKCNATLGQSWGLPDDKTRQNEFHTFLKEKDLTSVWLGIIKGEFATWSWLDNTPYTHSHDMDTGQGDQKQECGGLTIRDMGMIKPMRCSDKSGFVCEMPEGSSCTEPYHSHSCVYSGPKLYIVGCKSENWYDAREYCLRRGGDLAKLDTAEKISIPVDYIENKRFSGICSWLFIGLRKQRWLYWEKNKASNMTGEVNMMPWAHAEPRSGRDCVNIEEKGGLWRTSRCTDKHYVVCQNYGNITLKSNCEVGNSEKEDTKTKTRETGHYIGVVIASVGLLVLLVVLLCFIYRFRNIRYELKEETKMDPPTSKTFDGVTVVIFSPGIDKNDDQLKDIKIEHVKFGYMPNRHLGTPIAIEIAKAFQTTVGKAFKSKKTLRIVNVYGMGTEAEFKRMIQRYLLDSLSEELDYPLDVIFVPGNNLPVALRDLKRLDTLRNKYVCLSSTDREYSRVVSTEMIAVGVSNYTASSITSGVVDFTVDEASSKTCQSLEQGVAVAVGVVAGLLYLIKLAGQSIDGIEENMLKLPAKKTRFMRRLMIHILRGDKTEQSYMGYGLLNTNNFKDEETNNTTIREFLLRYRDERKILTEKYGTAEEEELKGSIKKLTENTGSTNSYIHLVFAVTTLENTDKFKEYSVKQATGDDTAIDYEPLFFAKAPNIGTSDKALTEFFDALELLCGSNAVAKDTKVTVVPALPSVFDIDWHKWRTHMEKIITDIKPDILFIAPIKSKWPSGMNVQSIIRKLKTQCVVFTAAVNMKGPAAPLAFPSDSVISVGSGDEEAAGSTLDFVACEHFHKLSQSEKLRKVSNAGGSSDETTHQIKRSSEEGKMSSKFKVWRSRRTAQKDDVEKALLNDGKKGHGSNIHQKGGSNDKTSQEIAMGQLDQCNTSHPWAPAMRAMAVAAVTLLKAKGKKEQLGLDDKKLNLLKQTTVMRNILVEMCNHPDHHSVQEGFGALHPLKFLGNDENFELLIKHYTNTENMFDFWSGKNV